MTTIDSLLGGVAPIPQDSYLTGLTVDWTKKSKEVNNESQEVASLVEKIVKKASSKQSEEFTTLVEKLFEKFEQQGKHMVYTNNYLVQVLELCLSKEKFWPGQALYLFIQKGFVPHSCIPKLISALITHEETEMMLQLIQTAEEVPESCVCTVLEHVLSCTEEHLASQSTDVDNRESTCEEDTSCPVSGKKAHCINAILNLPCNDVFLLEHLRKVPFQSILSLLEYLTYLLVRESNPESTQKEVSLLKVVEWICRVVDAHVTQLIISPDTRQILLNLHDVVQSQLQLYDELVMLDTLLSQLKEKSAIPQNQRVGPYCIEVLHIL